MKFLPPTFNEPQTSRLGRKTQELLEHVKVLEQGQWLPVEFDRLSEATSMGMALRKRGLTVVKSGAVLFIAAPADALPHSHRYQYPSYGGDDDDNATGICACGAKKDAAVSMHGALQRTAERQPIQGACEKCGFHKLSKKHKEECAAARRVSESRN